MKYLITENQKDKLVNVFNTLLNNLLDNMKDESEDWGLGEMSELEELNSVDHIGVDRIVTFNGLKVYVDFHVNKEMDDLENVWSEIQYRINQHIPHAKIIINDIIMDESEQTINESSTYLRRRVGIIDDEFKRSIDLFNPNDFFNFEDFMFSLVNSTVHRAMSKIESFGISKKDGKMWIPTYKFFQDYLKDNYMDEIKNRFYL